MSGASYLSLHRYFLKVIVIFIRTRIIPLSPLISRPFIRLSIYLFVSICSIYSHSFRSSIIHVSVPRLHISRSSSLPRLHISRSSLSASPFHCYRYSCHPNLFLLFASYPLDLVFDPCFSRRCNRWRQDCVCDKASGDFEADEDVVFAWLKYARNKLSAHFNVRCYGRQRLYQVGLITIKRMMFKALVIRRGSVLFCFCASIRHLIWCLFYWFHIMILEAIDILIFLHETTEISESEHLVPIRVSNLPTLLLLLLLILLICPPSLSFSSSSS